MTRLFFELNECGMVTPDAEGQEVPDLATARMMAIKAAREIMCAELSEGRLCLGCELRVIDEHGETVLHLPFKDVVTITGL